MSVTVTVGTIPDLSTGFTPAERAMVGKKILDKCDALDGVTDGLVQDTAACQKAFSLATDVPTCSAARDGTCLTAAQKAVVADSFAGAKTAANRKYSSPRRGLGIRRTAAFVDVSVHRDREPGYQRSHRAWLDHRRNGRFAKDRV